MKAIWKWVKEVFRRIGSMIVKALSYKTLAACVVTWVVLRHPSVVGTVLVTVMWALSIGMRYAEKVAYLAKEIGK